MKRIFITLSILLACALLFAVGMFVVLAIAPGSEIFGISYVSATIGKADISEQWPDEISGDIFINTTEIPVVINFEPYGVTKVEFVQNYAGYTTSKNRVPSAEITRDTNGVTVTTNEVVKFLIGSNKDSALTVTVPLSWAVSGTHSIYVNGQSSPVSINAGSEYTLRLDELAIKSKQKINFNSKLEVEKLKLNTNHSVVLGDGVNAKNVDFKSNAGDLTIKSALAGNLNAETTSGDIFFVSCEDATIKTSGGRVQAVSNTGCIINGTANITTKSGRVNIAQINGAGDSSIKTNNGDVIINKLTSAKITSTRGKISVGELASVVINGGAGDVKIGKVSDTATIKTKRGDVTVGDLNDKAVNNVSVSTTYGKIVLKNTRGEVSASTSYSTIALSNCGADKVSLSAGKTVLATGLTGAVNIWAKGNIHAAFTSVTDNCSVIGGKNCKKINISVDDYASNFEYNLTTTKAKKVASRLFVGNNISEQALKVCSPNAGSGNTLTVNAKKCNINLYTNGD